MKNPIDLKGLPAPDVIEVLSFEKERELKLARFRKHYPDYEDHPADPISKMLDEMAYMEIQLKERINKKCKAVMLAYATKGDLDNLAAFVPIERKLIKKGDPDANPPTEDVYEDCDDFRRRVQMAPEGFSTAGAEDAYIYHALAVVGVRDAQAVTPKKLSGEVHLHVLSNEGDGTPDQGLLDSVRAYLDDEKRPFTDFLTVMSPEIINYNVDAEIYLRSDPTAQPIYEEAERRLQAYVKDCHRLGTDVARSGIDAALHIEGVTRVVIKSPVEDVLMRHDGEEAYKQYIRAPYCTGVKLTRIQA